MTTATDSTTSRIERNGHLRWITVSDLLVDAMVQRDLRPGWAAQIAAEFDPDRFEPPLVSERHSKFYLIDGQHRVEALKLIGWHDQQVQCWVHTGLTEAQEADLFLWHNNRKPVSAFDKFRVGVKASRPAEADIERIVLAHGLKISKQVDGIGSVGALRKVYAHGPKVLSRTLSIISAAYGYDGFDAHVIEGVGLVAARYNGALDDAATIERLTATRGGLGALNTKAFAARKQLGKPLPQCVAAAVVEIVNAGKGGKKLPNWWA